MACKILFLIYPQTTDSIHFFWEKGECQYPGDSNRRIGRKNENDNPVRKLYICSPIITSTFAFFNDILMVIQGSDMEKLEKTCKKAVFMLLFPREIKGIKWENGNCFKSEVK